MPKRRITAAPASSESDPIVSKPICIGLQGGGAHGAFSWGVLDRLLEDGRLEIAGISGTSAGAMNAAVLADGLLTDGAVGGRRSLADFWRRVSDAGRHGPLQQTPLDRALGKGDLDHSPAWLFYDLLSRVVSPYQTNPLNINPLRDIVANLVDFDRISGDDAIKLFLCATNVKSGRIKVFCGEELSLDTVMASACLPHLFKAVEIDGEFYWDGGYMGNPPIYPLIYHTDCADVLLIQINPINIEHVPMNAREIYDRVNTLSFNSSLMREMRAIQFVTDLIDQDRLDPAKYKRMNIHIVDAEDELRELGVSSKINADWKFIDRLFELGRSRADIWLDRHFDQIGVESSIDIRSTFF